MRRAMPWLAGASNPEGEGRVPNITPGGKNTAGWSAGDIAYYLESGFTPEFDTAGGAMVAVQENMAELTKSDRDAIVEYLKAIPAVEDQARRSERFSGALHFGQWSGATVAWHRTGTRAIIPAR